MLFIALCALVLMKEAGVETKAQLSISNIGQSVDGDNYNKFQASLFREDLRGFSSACPCFGWWAVKFL